MTYQIAQGVEISIDGSTWYSLTDHNRQPINITYNLVEQADRMANGSMRKYVIARKFMHKLQWKDVPTYDPYLVDYNGAGGQSHGPAWIKAFYEGNYSNPVYVKFIFAQQEPTLNGIPVTNTYTSSLQSPIGTNPATGMPYSEYQAFMTTFTYDVTKRMKGNAMTGGVGYDHVDITIEFTEV
jgi:hypothetical protein